MSPVALGFRAGRGGAVVVGVAVDRPPPRVVLSAFLATAAEGDRLAFEPYQVAYEMPRAEGGGPTAQAAGARRRSPRPPSPACCKGCTARGSGRPSPHFSSTGPAG